jgi:hypothetical protein
MPITAQIEDLRGHAMGFLGPTQEDEAEEEEEVVRILSPRSLRYARRSNLHLTLLFLFAVTAPGEANNALITHRIWQFAMMPHPSTRHSRLLRSISLHSAWFRFF